MFGIWDRMLKRWVVLQQLNINTFVKAMPVFNTFKEAEEAIEDFPDSGFWEAKEFGKSKGPISELDYI